MTCVLTLALDEESQEHFEDLRRKYFPPERNQIPAHVTLFHTLRGEAGLFERLEMEAALQAGFRVAVTGLQSLGRGVAYRLASSELQSLHRRLAEAFAEDLSSQDRQRFQPHIVVQNKVSPEQARALLQELELEFQAMEITAVGLDLWAYLGGPWKLERRFSFRSSPLFDA